MAPVLGYEVGSLADSRAFLPNVTGHADQYCNTDRIARNREDERDDRRRSLGNIHRNISEFVGQVFFAGGFASDSDADARPR